MPTYDYVCRHCEHTFEQFQSMTAAPLRKCPACGRMQLKRLIGTGAGVIFKGSGFYETDYRSAEYRKQAKAEKEGSTSTTDNASNSNSAQSDAGGNNSKGDTASKSKNDSTTAAGSATSSGSD